MSDVTISRPTRDALGNRSDPTDVATLTGCAAEPVDTAQRPGRATEGAVERIRIYCPDPDADVRPGDLVNVGTLAYKVEGLPARWQNPFTGGRPGCVFEIERSAG
jgi:hypothetical protein